MYSQLQNLYPILLSDTIVYDRPMMLYIGTGGSLRVLTSGGDDVTLRNVPDGSTLPILVSKVFATGSTVGNVLATQFDGDVLNYFSTLPSWVLREYSLAFDAEGAEELGDYEAGTLYFRDSNFNRVPATFSRTTTATRVNEQGLIESVAANVPRIDYTDGSAKLLLEPSRTNVFPQSEFLTIKLPPNLTQTISDVDSPIKDLKYLKLEKTGASLARINQSATGSKVYTYSAFFKQGSTNGNIAMFACSYYGTSPLDVRFNLSTGAFVNATGTALLDYGFEDFGNGSYRVFATFNYDSVSTGTEVRTMAIYLDNGQLPLNEYIYITGIQIEEGSYPTSYTPTSGSLVTRNEETLTTLSGIPSQSTLYSDLSAFQSGDLQLSISGGSSSNRYVSRYSNSYALLSVVSGSIAANINGGSYTYGNLVKRADVFFDNDQRIYANGSFIVSATNSYTPFTPTRLTNDGFSDYYGTISKLILFPTALTDSELQQLTS